MLTDFSEIEFKFWSAIDALRSNTHIRASEYLTPILSLIFLKFVDQKFAAVDQVLQDRVREAGGRLILSPASYKAEGAIYLDRQARFSYLLSLNSAINAGVHNALWLIERDNPEYLLGISSSNDFHAFDDKHLKALLILLSDLPSDIDGDFFSKLYGYILSKFARAEGQHGGEFFTPISIVKLIVEIIEPFHGSIFDPACGSGGMFVQSMRFLERHQRNLSDEVKIHGQDKNLRAIRLCKMNLAVHNLSGNILHANSYYEYPQDSIGKFDYVLANPPFNVNHLDKERIKNDPRYIFGVPRTDNANYLWVQEFYSALNEHGRAGFVMPNSACDARFSELEIRRELIKDGVVDVIIAVGSNFFYTVTLPCTLWFFDKGKRSTERRNKVLFVDARRIYQQVDRAHREFSPQQTEFITNIIRLYRGEAIENFNDSLPLLQKNFPHNVYTDVPNLCKVVSIEEIAENTWSLNAGRYIGTIESQSWHMVQIDAKEIYDKNLNLDSKYYIESIESKNRFYDQKQKKEETGTSKRENVFISYSHKDQKALKRLQIHLAPIVRNYRVVVWDDTKILAGEKWRDEIKHALSLTKVAILLISADFIASEFIREDELPSLLKAAKEDNAIILPVVLSPSFFSDTELADFQSVNDISRPLSRMNIHEKEQTWLDVARRVKNALNSKK